MRSLLHRLGRTPLVGDGGMGSLLSASLPRLRCPEEANLAAPERVLELHLGFIRAGADVVQANTYGANRPKLAEHHLDERLEEILRAGVKLAREAREVSGRDVLVAGSIGPLGPGRDALDAGRVRALFAEQALVLAGRGVDLFVLETFTSLEELGLALEAVREAAGLPLVAQITVGDDGETLTGETAAAAARMLADAGVLAAGVNCSLGPQSVLAALEEMREACELPLSALPNAGLPSLAAGRVIYPDASPEYFREFAAQALSLGAVVIGGCCGTTPGHIAAVAEAVAERRRPALSFQPAIHAASPAPEAAPVATGLAARLTRGEFVVSVELDPPKGGTMEALVAAARTLAESGLVDVFDVNDNPMARARMNALVASAVLERELGVETIPHVTPRDASVRGLESLLLGAHAVGVRNLLAVTGDPPPPGDPGGARGVYEVDAVGLTRLISGMNEGVDYSGKALDAPTSFFAGVAVNPAADDLDAEVERFLRKVEAGARFAMTQVLFELGRLERFLERLGGASPLPLIVGIWPLRSHQQALRLHNEVPGIRVPERVLERLRRAGAAAEDEGFAIGRELLAGARERAAGAYVVPPFKQPEAALRLLLPEGAAAPAQR